MNAKKLPDVVDLRIIGACNLRCPFCYGPRHELGPALIEPLLSVVAQLPKYGASWITITGGEPLLVRGLPALLKTAKHVGLKINLSTNGLLLEKKLDQIAPFVDWIGLPLDGDCPEINQKMRVGHPLHFEIVLRLIPMLRAKYPHLGIKLGTVVTAVNKNHVFGLVDILNSDCRPDLWKLYHVIHSSYGADNRTWLELSSEEFEHIAAQIEEDAQRKRVPLSVFRHADRDRNKYLFLEPNGAALTVVDNQEISIGNYIDDFEGVIASWNAVVSDDQLANDRLDISFEKRHPLFSHAAKEL